MMVYMEDSSSKKVYMNKVTTCLVIFEHLALLSMLLIFGIFWIVVISSAVSLRMTDTYLESVQASMDVQAGIVSSELRSAINRLTSMGVVTAAIAVGTSVLIYVRTKNMRDYRRFVLVLVTVGFCVYWFTFAQTAVRSFIVNL